MQFIQVLDLEKIVVHAQAQQTAIQRRGRAEFARVQRVETVAERVQARDVRRDRRPPEVVEPAVVLVQPITDRLDRLGEEVIGENFVGELRERDLG